MRKLFLMGILAAGITGIVTSDAGAIGCGLFGSRGGDRQFTPVRNVVQRVRNVTNRVADRVLPRRRAQVDYVEVNASTERVQITGIRRATASCTTGNCNNGAINCANGKCTISWSE